MNAFGNFFNRTITFAHKYFDGVVPIAGQRDAIDMEQMRRREQTARKVAVELEACRFKAALAEVMALARAGNLYFDQTKPFASRKTDMAACGRAINVCLQTARTLTTITAPFLPSIARKCATMLGVDANYQGWQTATDELRDGARLQPADILVKKLEAIEPAVS